MLARGATPYDVAKLLGDEIATVEKHYAPFVRELRERVRKLTETGEGIQRRPERDFPHRLAKPESVQQSLFAIGNALLAARKIRPNPHFQSTVVPRLSCHEVWLKLLKVPFLQH